MGNGSFDINVGSQSAAGYAVQASVYRRTGSAFEFLPNVRVLSIDIREGAQPPVARFQYIMDDALGEAAGWPSQFEDVWPLDAQGYYVVRPDDRLVVADQNPDGSLRILFDGFADAPQADVSPRGQNVTFAAQNVAIREFDTPILGRLQRDASLAGVQDASGESDIPTNLPTRFNPADSTVGNRGGFQPNAVGSSLETIAPDGVSTYPVFTDPHTPWTNIEPAYWTVGSAIRYLLSRYNRDQTYVNNPNLVTIDRDLYDYAPAEGYQAMDAADPDSYTTQPVTIRDYDATNKPWPKVVADLLGYAGFYMAWDTFSDESGAPETGLYFYRRDEFADAPAKWVYLDRGASVTDSPNNVTGLKLSRDHSAIVNAWNVETSQQQVEVSIILLPLFRPTQGDENAPACNQYIKSNWTADTPSYQRRKYRWFGADELGEGHYGTNGWQVGNPCQFTDTNGDSAVFEPYENGNPTFVERYRPGHHTLISKDDTGRPLKATLHCLLPKKAGDLVPNIADPVVLAPGDWANLAADANVFAVESGWELLPDRLGIQVTVDDPRQWSTGGVAGDGDKPTLDTIDAISWWANPTASPDGRNFGASPILILTTVIDHDLILDATAYPRFVSPTKFARMRVIDGRDHFKYTTINSSSYNYRAQLPNDLSQDGDGFSTPLVIRDDTEVATAHANQLRSKHEFPPISGSITLPYITTYYDIGDQVSFISGRDVSLQTNIGEAQGEATCWPWIVGITYSFENDRQGTTLILSDKRADTNNAW